MSIEIRSVLSGKCEAIAGADREKNKNADPSENTGMMRKELMMRCNL